MCSLQGDEKVSGLLEESDCSLMLKSAVNQCRLQTEIQIQVCFTPNRSFNYAEMFQYLLLNDSELNCGGI